MQPDAGLRALRWASRFGPVHDVASVFRCAFFLRSMVAAPAPAIEKRAVNGPIGPPPGEPPVPLLEPLWKLLALAGLCDDACDDEAVAGAAA